MAVLPDAASERKLDLAAVWSDLHELRRLRVEVIPIRRCDFEEDRHTLRGVGGREYVFVRHVDRLAIGGHGLDVFEVEIGELDYGLEIGGILGMDFLCAAGAVVDLDRLTIEFRRQAAP